MVQLHELSSKFVSGNKLALLSFLFGINALLFPYAGFQHDSIFYAVQVLNRAASEKFSKDLFFLFGSQDNWSIFSKVVAPFVSIFGLNFVFFILYLIAKIFFLYVSIRLISLLVASPLNVVIATIIVTSRSEPYAGFGMLNVNESFLTPRILAEPFILLGLSFFLERKYICGILSTFIASLFHPLISAAGWGVLFFHFWIQLWGSFDRPKRLFMTLGTSLVILGAIYIGLTLVPFDDVWWTLIKKRSPLNFITEWWVTDFINIVFAFLIVVISLPYLPKLQKTTAIAVLIVSLGGGLLSLVSEYFGSIFILKLQFYRCFWLLVWISIPIGIELISNLWFSQKNFSKLLSVIFGCLISRDFLFSFAEPIWLVFGAICCLGSYAYFRIRARESPFWEIAPTLALTSIISFYVFLLVWSAGYLVFGWFRTGDMGKLGQTYTVARSIISGPLLIYFLYILSTKTSLFKSGVSKPCFVFSLVGLLVLIGGYIFAARDTFAPSADLEKIENRSFIVSHFSNFPKERLAHFSDTLTLYWPLETRIVWFKLGANQYFDNVQLAGLMFSRGTAIEGKRRLEIVKPFEVFSLTKYDLWSKKNAWLLGLYEPKEISLKPTFDDLLRLCTEPVVDFAILEHDFKIKSEATNGKVFIYSCDTIRKEKLS